LRRVAQGVQVEHLAGDERGAAGEERAAMTAPPGVFAPSCPDHYTIYANETVYNVSVPVGGQQLTFFDTWNNWVAAAGSTVAVSSGVRGDKCR